MVLDHLGGSVVTAVSQGLVGIDLRIYRDAATVAVNGGNPWNETPGGGYFTGPPPTVLFYLILRHSCRSR